MQVTSYNELGNRDDLIDPWTHSPMYTPRLITTVSCLETCNDLEFVADTPNKDSIILANGALQHLVPDTEQFMNGNLHERNTLQGSSEAAMKVFEFENAYATRR